MDRQKVEIIMETCKYCVGWIFGKVRTSWS